MEQRRTTAALTIGAGLVAVALACAPAAAQLVLPGVETVPATTPAKPPKPRAAKPAKPAPAPPAEGEAAEAAAPADGDAPSAAAKPATPPRPKPAPKAAAKAPPKPAATPAQEPGDEPTPAAAATPPAADLGAAAQADPAPPKATGPKKPAAKPVAQKPAPPAAPDASDPAADAGAAPAPAKPAPGKAGAKPAVKPAAKPAGEPAPEGETAAASDAAAPARPPGEKAAAQKPARGKATRDAKAAPAVPGPPLPEPLPVLQPAKVADPALVVDGRLLGQRPIDALPTPTGDNPTLVVTRSMGRTPRSLYPAESLSPPGVAVHDTVLQSPDSSDGAPVAMNSFEAIKAGVPAGPFRAGLVEESESEIDRPRIETGTVMWRIENPASGGPEAPPTALIAEVIIDKTRLKTVLTIRPGREPGSGPLAIDIVMGGEPGAVTQIGVPELRNPGIERGIPLFGAVAAPVQGAPFTVALADNDRDGEQNVRLLTSRPWIDIPFRMKNGKRYTLAFEKGTAVREMMRSAFRAWRLPWLP